MRFLGLRVADLLFRSFISVFVLCAASFAQTAAPTCTLSVSPAGGPAPLSVSASGACTQGTLPLATVTLDFGDGSAPLTQQYPTGTSQATISGDHTYSNPRATTYFVTVTATDLSGQSGQASQGVSVNASPTCTFTVDKNIGPAPLTITADVSCTDPENDIRTADIAWGDGTFTNLACDGSCRPFHGTHTYANPNVYTASVRATDSFTGTQVDQRITAQGPPPTCNLILDKQSGGAPLTVDATGSNCTSQAGFLENASITWGDGTSDSLSCDGSCNPFQGGHTYPKTGTYTVTLQASDNLQTTGSTSKTVTVADSTPSCTLTPNSGDQGVAPFSETFSGSCTDAGNDISSANSSATLNFGDNTPPQTVPTANAGNFSNISHVYQTSGTYTAAYTVRDDSGHTTTANSIITVSANQPPTCTLTLDKNNGTAPLTVTATANCSDPDRESVNSMSIDWGDGSPTQPGSCDGPCGFTGPHTYTSPGTYMIVVTGTDSAGLKGSANQTVTVTQPVDSTPKCSLSSDSQNGAAPFTVTFSGSCQDAGNDLFEGSTGTLDFGDNTTPQQVSPASFSNVSHVYQSPATYTATFTATDSSQHTGSSSLTITVTTPVNSTPICTLNSDKQTGQAPLTVNFTGSCSDAGNDLIASSQSFNFGDGTATQTGTSASHTYAQPGTYQATFSASDSHQNTGSTSQTITVTANQPPSCTLQVNPSSGQIPFTTTATGSCTDPENDIASTSLNWGDGTIENGKTSGSHTYAASGSYQVTVTATDQGGLTGTASQTVFATNNFIQCSLSVDSPSGPAPHTINATGSCTTNNGGLRSLTIDWGDNTAPAVQSGFDGQNQSTFTPPPHTYNNVGTYTVTLTGQNGNGQTSTDTKTVTVTQSIDSTPKCTLNSNPGSGVNPLTVNFNGSCTDAGGDISSAGSSASLDFGDNTAPQSISTANAGTFSGLSHVYQSPGTYTATYTVTDDSKHTGTATHVITVTQNQPPTCTLTLDKNSGTAPLTVNATASCNDSDDNVNTASIDWGDGSAAQSLNCDGSCFFRGSHTYTAPGTYMAVVTGTDAGGLSGSANQTVTVTAPVDSTPKCSLNSDSQNGAAPFAVTFSGSCQDAGNDLGQGSTGTLDFGDKTPPQQVSPATFSNVSHVYQVPGTYTATFTATDSTQHTGTSSLTITVTTPVDSTPMCTLNSDKQTGPAPLTVNFTGSCSDAGNDLIASSQSFDFGDGTATQSGTSANHTYAQPGTYHATFSASDAHGNKGSTSQTITVTMAPNRPPSCTLTVSPSSGQAPLTVTATGNCTDPENDISSTTLNFGDGTVQSGTSGTHTYTQSGTFTVTVSATDTGGLNGAASQTVTASAPPPQAPSCTLSVTPSSGQVSLTVTATGNCTAGTNPITGTTLDFGDGTTLNASSGTHTYNQAGTFTAKITATDSLGLSGSATQNVTVNASKFPQGVFVGIHGGTLTQFATDGTVLKTLNTGLGGTVAGMAFDSAGTLYAADFTAGNISKFDLKTGTLIGTFGSGFTCQPETVVFDGAGNAYVGQQGCSRNLLKFDPSGKLLASYTVATEEQGSDDIDLSADQCTLLYTSEGPSILRYDVCSNRQLTPFATGLKKALTLRILPDGGVIVGDLVDVVHLNSAGQPVMTYTAPGEQCLYAVTLDQDGASFWAADYCSSNIYRFDIASGKQLSKFNTGTPSGSIFGLAIAGTGLNVAGLGNGGTMTASPQTATLASGQSATFTISFTPNAASAGHTLTLSCASLPPGLSCSFTPQTITLGAAGTTTTATLTITRTTTAALHQSSTWMLATWMGVFPAMVLVGFRSPRRRRRGSLLWLGLIVASTGIWASCGGGGMSRTATPQPTPQGAYTVIVVGTASGAQASTTVNLTVQ